MNEAVERLALPPPRSREDPYSSMARRLLVLSEVFQNVVLLLVLLLQYLEVVCLLGHRFTSMAIVIYRSLSFTMAIPVAPRSDV